MLAPLELELEPELVQAGLPQTSVLGDPRVEFAEALGAKRIQTLSAVGANLDEARLLKNSEVSRHTGLVNVDGVDNVVDRLLPPPEHLHNPAARRVGQGLERINMHTNAYV